MGARGGGPAAWWAQQHPFQPPLPSICPSRRETCSCSFAEPLSTPVYSVLATGQEEVPAGPRPSPPPSPSPLPS